MHRPGNGTVSAPSSGLLVLGGMTWMVLLPLAVPVASEALASGADRAWVSPGDPPSDSDEDWVVLVRPQRAGGPEE